MILEKLRAPHPESARLKRRRVVIVQRYVRHYRVPFYQRLRAHLDAQEIDLHLLAGAPDPEFAMMCREMAWADTLPVRKLPGGALWLPALTQSCKADLVIVEDASKQLLNYVLWALRYVGGPKLALWGHGWNHQANNQDALPERLKSSMSRRVDWFFAYTFAVREALIGRGYDGSRITDVQNAVEKSDVEIDLGKVEKWKRDLGIEADAKVAFSCNEMYELKRLDVLIEAATLVKRAVPSFHLVVAGAGPSQDIVARAAQEHDYIHYVGPVFEKDKASLFALSQLSPMAGLVGLGLVDAFHHGVPPVVCRLPYHSPEIAYLSHGTNGLMVGDNAANLAEGMIQILTDRSLHERLVAGCEVSSNQITIDAMAERFSQGIQSALEVGARTSTSTL